MKLYTYYRKGICRWRCEIAKEEGRPSLGLRHLSYGQTKEDCEARAREKLKDDVETLMNEWLSR